MSEVRAYLRSLVTVILIGVVLMGATALWAWSKYGQKLKDAPPLPEAAPFRHQP